MNMRGTMYETLLTQNKEAARQLRREIANLQSIQSRCSESGIRDWLSGSIANLNAILRSLEA